MREIRMLRTTWRELETELRDGLRHRLMAKAAGKRLLPGPKATAPALDPTGGRRLETQVMLCAGRPPYPLQCPRCQSLNVGSWGTYHAQPGLKRYRCKEKGCKRTFNDLTGTLLDGSKRSLAHWILATFLLCLSCSSRRIANELGVHVRTGYRWCWWLRVLVHGGHA